MMVSEPTKV